MPTAGAVDLSLAEGWALLIIGGVSTVVFLVGLHRLWAGLQDSIRFWVHTDGIKNWSFAQFALAYLTGAEFKRSEYPMYHRSRNRFGVGFGLVLLSLAFYIGAMEFAYRPLVAWFEQVV